jgi:hypothetical protein
MAPLWIAALAFGLIFGGALLGIWLRDALPSHHLNDASKDVVKLGMGLIGTMAALVLGLVTASAKSAYDAQDAALKHMAATTLGLDRVLARYGPETQPIRDLLRQTLTARIEAVWPKNGARAEMGSRQTIPAGELIEDSIRSLSPQTDAQRALRDRALSESSDLLDSRWTVFGAVDSGTGGSIPTPFLVIVIFWLSVIFWSFGLFAPRNATVLAVLFLSAISVAASIFLILEMDRPFEGIMQLSSAPLVYTLSHLGR